MKFVSLSLGVVSALCLLMLTGIMDCAIAQEVEYTSKLDGKRHVFVPAPDKLLIRFRDGVSTEDAATIVGARDLTIFRDELEKLNVGVFSVSAGGDLGSITGSLTEEYLVDGVSPVYLDDDGYERYIDPRWVVVGFNDQCDEGTRRKAITEFHCELIVKRSGYYVVSVLPGRGVFEAISDILQSEDVEFAEPYHYTFDGLDADTYLSSEWHLENTGQETGFRLPRMSNSNLHSDSVAGDATRIKEGSCVWLGGEE